MFTGIIQGIGHIKAYDQLNFMLRIGCPLFSQRRPALGASIAIDGVCLTVAHFYDEEEIGFDLGTETRRKTLLTQKHAGDMVNVEYALHASASLDGHLVQGHVDGLAELLEVVDIDLGRLMRLRISPSVAHLLVPKGAVAINGVSLTINEMEGDDVIAVGLVPHTIENTSFKSSKAGDRFHVETDIIGRYLWHFHHRLNRSDRRGDSA